MKIIGDSSKEDKREVKIKFEKFPGEVKKESIIKVSKQNILDNNKKGKKHILLYVLAIFILIALFVFSTMLNKRILYGKEDNHYKVINEFDGNYAIINPNERVNLFKEIGFEEFETKINIKNGKSFLTTSAIHKDSKESLKYDTINVYYDENYYVSYIEMKLMYKKDEFSISKVTLDCNDILNNFIKIKTSKNAVSEVKSNGYYYFKDSSSKIKAIYRLVENSKEYYLLTINIEK